MTLSPPTRHLERLEPYRGPNRTILLVASICAVVGIAAIIVGSGPAFRSPKAIGATSGDLYFTTFSPGTVDKVTYSLVSGHLHLAPIAVIAHLPGADGIAFSPDGHLVVGAGNGSVYSVSPDTGQATSIKAGSPAFMIAISRDGRTLYTGGLPGPLAAVPLDPLGPGRLIALRGDDTVISGMAFSSSGLGLYTSSGPDGRGDIGTINLTDNSTHRLFQGVPGAHGVVYDPYTDTFIVTGGSTIEQLSASDPSQVVSQTTLATAAIDQGAVDGHGHALLASNTGNLISIDYSATHRIGDLSDRVSIQHLAYHLDDAAPLIGPGAKPQATLAATWRGAGVALLVVAIAGFAWEVAKSARRRSEPRRPRWDRRRQISDRSRYGI